MNNCIFLSKFLKYKNNKIYLLSYEDLKTEDYINNTYYINYDDLVLSNKLIIDNKVINYSLKKHMNNLIIYININESLNKNEIINLMYIIEQYISGVKNINNLYDINISEKNLNYYNNFYIF